MILLQKHSPFEKTENGYHSFLRFIGLQSDFDAWTCEKAPGLFLNAREEPRQMVLSGKIDEVLSDQELEYFPAGESRESKIVSWSHFLEPTLATWALYELSRDFEKRMAKTRDAYGALDLSADTKAASEEFGKIDHEFCTFQRNILPFAGELISYCHKKPLFMHGVYEFRPLNERRRELVNVELFESLRQAMLRSAKYIRASEKQIQAIAERTGQMLSSISMQELSVTNIRLQGRVVWMTLVMLVLTCVLVLLAKMGDETIWEEVLDFISNWRQ
jgi:hypothetical protein